VNDVESFVDVCHSLDNMIDPWLPFRDPRKEQQRITEEEPLADPGRLKGGGGYLEEYINPPEFLEAQRQKLEKARDKQRKLPPHPERDVLGFLLRHARLESWEADVLSIIREEAYYFLPQMQTKIMNEGWATYWHSKIMTERALTDDEVIDYADVAAGVMAMAPNQLNPYKIGVELYRNLEDRWNKGKFGKEWDECDNQAEKDAWDKKLGLGRSKIFEVRRMYNDVTFIDEFFTLEFCREQKFFTFVENRRSGQFEIEGREFEKVKQQMLGQLTNAGQPFIYVIDANYLNRGELLLGHRHEGIDLKLNYARETLKNLERLWRRPVSILTIIDDKAKRIRFDGSEVGIADEPEAWRL
jgi:stage V sporulation protein R